MAYDGAGERTRQIDLWPEAGDGSLGDERQDRLGIHLIWEPLLLIIVVATAIIAYQMNADSLLAELPGLLVFATSLGVTAVGLAWSVRAATPNLAAGPIFLAAAVFFTQQSESGVFSAVGVTLGAALTIGMLLSIVVVGFHVPAWAGSLAAALGLTAWPSLSGGIGELPESVTYNPAGHAVYWFVGFAGLSLASGMVGLLAPVRRGIGAFRGEGDPSQRPGFGAALGAMTAILGSCFFAAAGGILLALSTRSSLSEEVSAVTGIGFTGLVLGAVLVGGTSAYGRRGGLFGTLLGVTLVALVLHLDAAQTWQAPIMGYAAAALFLGLLVTRLVETGGRLRATSDDGGSRWDMSGAEGSRDDPGGLPDRPQGAAPGDRASRLSGQLRSLGELSGGGKPKQGSQTDALFRARIWDSQPESGPASP